MGFLPSDCWEALTNDAPPARNPPERPPTTSSNHILSSPLTLTTPNCLGTMSSTVKEATDFLSPVFDKGVFNYLALAEFPR